MRKETIDTNVYYRQFTKKMTKFYKCNHIPENIIESLLFEYRNYIKEHLVATPELVARKIFNYQFKTDVEYAIQQLSADLR